MTFEHFVKELNGKRVEGELIVTGLYSFITSIIVIAFFYFLLMRGNNLLARYGFYLFFSALSYALITPLVRQVRAYGQFACMPGMMIGMTAGMMSGFLAGFMVGATNGMFVGSMFGMAVGIILGIWLGKCCGVMGLLEGVMAGLMAGLMGAMSAVMLLFEHLRLSTVVIFLISSVILIGLYYMVYQEKKEHEAQIDHISATVAITLLLMAATSLVILIGPRSVVLQ